VVNTFEDYLHRFVTEDYLPFETTSFLMRKYSHMFRFPPGATTAAACRECEPKTPRSTVRVNANDIRLVYLLLMHEEPSQAIRLIEALQVSSLCVR
jgi:hypothetical protein